MKAQLCCLSPNGYFNLTSAPYPPQTPTPLPLTHLPLINSICDITGTEKII